MAKTLISEHNGDRRRSIENMQSERFSTRAAYPAVDAVEDTENPDQGYVFTWDFPYMMHSERKM